MVDFLVDSFRRRPIDGEHNTKDYINARQELAERMLSYMPSVNLMTGDFEKVRTMMEECGYNGKGKTFEINTDDIENALASAILLGIPDKRTIDQAMIDAFQILAKNFPKCVDDGSVNKVQNIIEFMKRYMGKQVMVGIW